MELFQAVYLFNKRAKEDAIISPSHIALYTAFLYFWTIQKQVPISITRKEVMLIAHVKGIATYQKCIRELHNNKYIIYKPSFDPRGKSLIYFNNLLEI